jgi:hypothetical protein
MALVLRLRAAVAELPFSDAVTVAVWPDRNEPACALKFAVAAPGGTVAEEGTVRKKLLLFRATAMPLPPAADFRKTVQVLVAARPRTDGAQASLERRTDGVRLSVAVRETAPIVAVTIAF